MANMSRRSLIKGAFAGAGIAAFQSIPGARFVRAQGAAYTIVSFGPVAEGVRPDGFMHPQFGAVIGVTPGGVGFGRIGASAEKFTPALFGIDGVLTKLKSGEFGGSVAAINAAGNAVGSAYDTIGGEDDDPFSSTRQQPVAWIDGEFVRLPTPDPESESSVLAGYARNISDDGVILGFANGHNLLWTDGEPEILPKADARNASISYHAITATGDLIGVASLNDSASGTTTSSYGIVRDANIDTFTMPDEFAIGNFFRGTNSLGHALYIKLNSDIYRSAIAVPGGEPIVINSGEDGASFLANGMNASNQVVGTWQDRAADDYEPTLWQDGTFTLIESLLPADHGFHNLTATGISDDGIIASTGWDVDGGFHPLLLVPA